MGYSRDITGEQFTRDWKAWRAGWEQWLVAPHGWLSARSLCWLDATPRRYPGLPGLWSQDHGEVVIDPEGATMSFGGASFDTVRRLLMVDAPDDQRVAAGELEIGITYRETYMIVVYDPDAPTRLHFRGVPVFEPNPDWVLTGHYEPYESSSLIKLGSVDPGLSEHTYDSPGRVHFQHDHHTYSLQVLRSGGTLNTVFADGTSGVTTYSAGRSLVISDVGEDGRVRLDFNRAVNLPCAFSDNFPICPVPPPSNRLPFAIEAGEQTPREKTG
ncbi:DUF1684 domain-containing protein [Streptantibioticus ferralitis]|uniref:DUF1684 domain-containing protein n=1 Tax=Streptantibioticus ferralitis TaxID=236510 RepID=A0ABT5Z0W9_9ACTN|nr:DUF1684 domain-containing protein [Streptantibioticus ferralitis]MDF2257429.1 DUF1684 domain-containing protein [Streptantibioticus ferralitis]